MDDGEQFADGGYYIKNKLDTLARDLLNAEYAKSEAGKKTKQEEGNGSGKVDDTHVQFLVRLPCLLCEPFFGGRRLFVF